MGTIEFLKMMRNSYLKLYFIKARWLQCFLLCLSSIHIETGSIEVLLIVKKQEVIMQCLLLGLELILQVLISGLYKIPGVLLGVSKVLQKSNVEWTPAVSPHVPPSRSISQIPGENQTVRFRSSSRTRSPRGLVVSMAPPQVSTTPRASETVPTRPSFISRAEVGAWVKINKGYWMTAIIGALHFWGPRTLKSQVSGWTYLTCPMGCFLDIRKMMSISIIGTDSCLFTVMVLVIKDTLKTQ